MSRAARWLAHRLSLVGNLAFLVGSVAFLSDVSQTFGVWLFIVGSVAFLLEGMRPSRADAAPGPVHSLLNRPSEPSRQDDPDGADR